MKLITQILILLITSFPSFHQNNNGINISENKWIIQTQNEIGTIYKGDNYLEGWIIFKERYGSENKEPHFHINNDSLNNLPEDLQEKIVLKPYFQDFIILPEDTAIIKKLTKYKKEDPATIRVNKLILTMEGPPFLNLVEILE